MQREIVGMPDVVRIERRDEFAVGEADGCVARVNRPAIGLPMQLDAVVPVNKSSNNRSGIVRRAIIDDNDGKVRVVLRQGGSQGPHDGGSCIVGRDYDGQPRQGAPSNTFGADALSCREARPIPQSYSRIRAGA